MRQTINHRRRHLIICEDRAPFGEFQIRNNDEAAAFVAISNDPEQQLRTFLVDGDISPLIQHQKLAALDVAPRRRYAWLRPAASKVPHGIEFHGHAQFTGTQSCGNSRMRLARSDGSIEYQIAANLKVTYINKRRNLLYIKRKMESGNH
ncbi:hypothetical protein P9314_11045 [Paenibacillus validus]|nr:hypothetical protein [Paenibacillus validus]MED4607501.1 hypothetical protein [Paenibacillus validus]